MQAMLQAFLNVSGLPESLGELPVTMMDPIYGEKNPTFTNYVAPGEQKCDCHKEGYIAYALMIV